MICYAPPVGALQSQPPLLRLLQAAARLCSGSAELLTFGGCTDITSRKQKRLDLHGLGSLEGGQGRTLEEYVR